MTTRPGRCNNLQGVSAEHRPLVEHLLKTQGSYSTQRAFADSGIVYTFHAIDAVRRAMDKQGTRCRPVGAPGTAIASALNNPIDVAGIARCSKALLRATVRALERIAEEERIPVEHAGVLALYGREAFERWLAA